MKEERCFCLRVDVDTFEGLKKGLPEIAQFSKKQEIPLTVYLSLGKYATGKNVFRLLKKREIPSFRVPPWQRNSLKSLFRGILLPSKNIGSKEIKLLQGLDREENIEIHSHGYYHVNWSSNFSSYRYDETKRILELMRNEYVKIFKREPFANAAPNFSVNEHYFKILSAMKYRFSSDFIYKKPFFLEFETSQKTSKKALLQLPITEKSIEEFLLQGKSSEDILQEFEKRFRKPGINGNRYTCFYIHAIFEPLKFKKLLESISDLVYRNDLKPTTHNQFSKNVKDLQTISYRKMRN